MEILFSLTCREQTDSMHSTHGSNRCALTTHWYPKSRLQDPPCWLELLFFYPAFDWTCYLSRCLNYILVSMASVFYFVAKDVVFFCSQPVDTRAKPCLLPPGIRVLGSLFTSLRDEVATRIQRWQFHGHALDAIDLDGFSPWLSDCRRPLVSIEATV